MSEYNGWSNYETWNWNLWMENDEGWYSMTQEAAKDIASEDDDKDEVAFTLRNYLKAECDEMAEQWMPGLAGPFSDLLNSAISEINFYEIAESILEDLE